MHLELSVKSTADIYQPYIQQKDQDRRPPSLTSLTTKDNDTEFQSMTCKLTDGHNNFKLGHYIYQLNVTLFEDVKQGVKMVEGVSNVLEFDTGNITKN